MWTVSKLEAQVGLNQIIQIAAYNIHSGSDVTPTGTPLRGDIIFCRISVKCRNVDFYLWRN